MSNQITPNPDFPDIFMGAMEQAGEFTNDKTGEKIAYHYFLLNIAVLDMDTNDSTVSYCGYENLGLSKGANDKLTDKRKVKADDMASIFGTAISSCDVLAPFVGQPCEVLWDKKGVIKRIRFEKNLMSNELLKPKK